MSPLLLAAVLFTAPPLRVELTPAAAQLVCRGAVRLSAFDGRTFTDPALTVAQGELMLGDQGIGPATRVTAADGGPVRVEVRARRDRAATARRYRGGLVLRAAKRGLQVVNEVDLEDYVRGVVPVEIGDEGPAAALQAQAVAARSLALFRRGDGSRFGADFDVASTQAYRGCEPESRASDAAVRATAGQVLTVGGRVMESVYSDCCGGVTTTGEEAWQADIPGLCLGLDASPRRPPALGDEAAVRRLLAAPCGWCRQNPLHRWRKRWPWSQVAARLAGRLPRSASVGTPTSLVVTTRGASGRATVLTVTGPKGQAQVRGDSAIRGLLGEDSWLPSSLFVVDREGDALVLTGGGHGHGVGLCQSGALAMGAEGKTAAEILKHYYPGASSGAVSS